MADLEINISADASQLVNQMQQASDSAKDLASALNSSAESVVGSGAKIDAAFEGIGEAAQTAAASLTPSAAALDTVGASIGSMLEQITGVGTEIGSLGPAFAAIAPAALSSAEATLALGSSFASAAEGIDSLLGPLVAVGEEENLVGQSASQMELSFAAAAAGAENLLLNLGATGESLAEIVSVVTETEDVIGSLGASFNLSDEAINQMSASLGGMLTDLSAVGGEVATTVEQLSLFSTTVDAANASSNQFDSALSALQAIVPETAALFDSLMASTRGAGEAAANTAQQYSLLASFDAAGTGVKTVDTSGTTAALSAATSQLTAAEVELNEIVSNANTSWYEYAEAEQRVAEAASEVGSSQFALISQITELQGRLNAATAEKVALNSSLASSAGEVIEAEQYELALMEQLAEAQASLAASNSGGVTVSTEGITEAVAAEHELAEAEAEVTAATNVTTETINRLFTELGAAGKLTLDVKGALNFLSSEEAGAAESSTTLALAMGTVAQAASKIGYALTSVGGELRLVESASVGAAVGLNQVGGSANNAAEGVSRFTVAAGGAGARLGAAAIGAGQFGYALASLSRVIPVLSTALSYLFPIFAIAAGIEIIESLTEKFRNLQQQISKTQVEFDDLATASIRSADSLEQENLKIEDQIAKLEGRPTSNRLQEAIIQSREEVDKLTDAFERALEKYEELLKAGEVGFFKNLITGVEETTGFEDAVKDQIAILKAKVAAQNEATAAYNLAKSREDAATSDSSRLQAGYDVADAQSAKTAAASVVAVEQEKTLKLLEEQQKQTSARKRAALDAIAADEEARKRPQVAIAGQTPRTPGAEELSQITAYEDARRAIVERNYSEIQTQEASLVAGLKNHILSEEELNEVIKNRSKLAVAGDVAEGQKRAYTEQEAAIKRTEATAIEEAKAESKATQDSIKLLEDKAKLQASLDTEHGVVKPTAALDAIQQEIDGVAAGVAAKITEQEKYLKARTDLLAEERTLIEKEKVGPDRTKLLEDNAKESERILIENKATEASIVAEGEDAITRLETDASRERAALAKKSSQDIIIAEREATRAAIDDAKEAASERINYAKAASEEETRLAGTRVTGISATSTVHITGLKEEQAAIDAAYESEKAALVARQAIVQADMVANKANAAVIAELAKEYFNLSEAIKKVNTEEVNFDTSSTKAQVDAITQSWKDQTAVINNFVASATSDLNNFVTTIATTNVNIQQVWSKMVFSMEKQFIEMILHLIEQTAAFQAISNTIEGTFKKVFESIHLIPKPPTGAPPPSTPPTLPSVPYIAGGAPGGENTSPTAIPGVVGAAGPYAPFPGTIGGATSTASTEAAFTTAIGANTLALQANTAALSGQAVGSGALTVPPLNTPSLGLPLPTPSLGGLPLPTSAATTGTTPTTPAATPVVVVGGAPGAPGGGVVGGVSTAASQINTPAPAGASAAVQGAAQVGGIAGGAAQVAEQSNITSLRATGLALSLFQSALRIGTAAQVTHTGVVTTGTAVQTSQTAATGVSAAATGTHAAVTTGDTAATAVHTGGLFANIGALFAHTGAVITNMFTFIGHTIAVIADKIALIAHAIVALFTGGAATGGLIEGPGTGTSDSIPLRVSHGEFIVKAQSVAKPGMLELLHGINKGQITAGHPGGSIARGFAEGGLVSEESDRGSSSSAITSNSFSVSERNSSSAVSREISSMSSSIDKSLSSTAASVFTPVVNPETSGGIGSTVTPVSALSSSVSAGDRGVADSLKGQFDQLSSTLSSSTSSSNLALGVLKKSLGAMIAGIPAQDRSLTTNIKNQFEQVSGALNNTAASGNTALGTLNKSLGAMVVNASPSDNRQLLAGINSRLANASSLTPTQNLAQRLSYTAPGGLNSTTSIAHNTSNTNLGDTSNSNFHFNFNPTVHGDFDVNKHGEELFRFIQGKLRRMGGGRKI